MTGGRADSIMFSSIIRHNGEEFLLIDFSVLVKVEFINHGLPGS
jgi:hypothetical protein